MKNFVAPVGRSGKLPREVQNLGPLQREIAEIVYASKYATADEVLEGLSEAKKNATVRTTLNRLVAKGVLRRVLSDRTYIYLPAISKKDSAAIALIEFAEIHFEGSLNRAAEEMWRLTSET